MYVTVDGVDIQHNRGTKGYYYYDYRDTSDVLHRVYNVKNVRGTKDYSERWYSQLEWLPKIGIGRGSKGSSEPLAIAIMSADGSGELDELLKQYLKQIVPTIWGVKASSMAV